MYRGGDDDRGNDDGDDEDEFEAAAREVGEQLSGAAHVPDVVEATVDEWLRRLTAAGRGPAELDHLRLLRLMVANGRVGRPFLRPPPATGRLLPLSVYLRPRPGPGGVPATAATGHRRGDSYAWTAGPADQPDQPPTVPGLSDGRLTGGGGGDECACRPDAADGGQTGGDAPGGLCDPCRDRLGLRPRPGTPKPLDAAYRDLLGDCEPPRLTKAERLSVDPGLLRVLQAVDDATTLQDFYFQVSLHTADRGSLLISASDEMVDNFRAFVRHVLAGRTERIGDRLVDEQTSARDRYARLRDRALNRAAVALDHVRETLPAFDWREYRTEPDAYLRRQALRRAASSVARDGGEVGAADGDGDADGDGGGDVDGDGDADGGGDVDGDGDPDGRSAGARALLALDELWSEVAVADRSNGRLLEERDALTVRLAELGERLSAARARQADDVRRLRDEVTLLRGESADQKARVDRLTASIQLQLAAAAADRQSC